MNGTGDYTPIPDVEQPVEKPLDPKEKYSGANDEQAVFLSGVDACIDESRLQISIDYAPPQDAICSWTACGCLCVLTLWSVAIFIGAVALGHSRVYRSHTFTECFPYTAAFIVYLVSCFIIDGRIMGHATFVFAAMNKISDVLSVAIDDAVQVILGRVSIIQAKLTELLGPIKSSMEAASKSEAAIKKIDPSIDSVGVGDVESELDGVSTKIHQQSTEVKEALDLDTVVPGYLQGPCAFRCRTVIPLLLFYLALQMAAAYGFKYFYPKYFNHKHLTVTSAAPTLAPAMVMPNNTTNVTSQQTVINTTPLNNNTTTAPVLTKMLNETQNAFNLAKTTTVTWVAGAWYYVLAVLLAYIVAFIEILFVLCCTGMAATMASINKVYENVAESANRMAREKGLSATVEDAMGNKMVFIRTKFLAILDKQAKIDAALTKVPAIQTAPRRESNTIASVKVTESPNNQRRSQRSLGKKQSSRFGRFFGKGGNNNGK